MKHLRSTSEAVILRLNPVSGRGSVHCNGANTVWGSGKLRLWALYPDSCRHLESPNYLEFLLVKARHWSFLVLQFWDSIMGKWKQRKQQKTQTNLMQFRAAQPLFLLQLVLYWKIWNRRKKSGVGLVRCWFSKFYNCVIENKQFLIHLPNMCFFSF